MGTSMLCHATVRADFNSSERFPGKIQAPVAQLAHPPGPLGARSSPCPLSVTQNCPPLSRLPALRSLQYARGSPGDPGGRLSSWLPYMTRQGCREHQLWASDLSPYKPQACGDTTLLGDDGTVNWVFFLYNPTTFHRHP